jgi:hypothetical protein
MKPSRTPTEQEKKTIEWMMVTAAWRDDGVWRQ